MVFSLVDRITSIDPGRSARGSFTVPASMAECPAFLLAEAVGQLASWATMAHLEFRSRPVAALAGNVDVFGPARGGDLIELEVHLDGIERGGALYGGSASVGGRPLLVMRRCVGPLLPMEDFDDPDSVRAVFRGLREGPPSCGLSPVSPAPFEVLAEEPGERLRMALQVPRHAPFFAEHFPRKPVYPATVLLDRKIDIARHLLRHAAGNWRVTRATHVKISAFTLPGERLEIEAQRVGEVGDTAVVQLTGFRDGTRVSRARMEFARN